MEPDRQPKRPCPQARVSERNSDNEQGREPREDQRRLRELVGRMRERNETGEPAHVGRGLLRRFQKMDNGKNRGAHNVRRPWAHRAKQNPEEQSAEERLFDERDDGRGERYFSESERGETISHRIETATDQKNFAKQNRK